MAKYKFAFNSKNEVISADKIANKPVDDAYHCLGCGNELTAKVNGQVKKPHFAHKVQIECSGESYLHNLGKQTFYQTYLHCLENNEPFNITLTSAKVCRKFRPLILTDCNLGETKKTFDLTDYFHKVELEKKDGQFIPDLMLVSTKKPSDKIYIEIAVTHFMSDEKEFSGNKIIEIPLEYESDVSKISKAHLTPADAMFIGFNQSTTAITDHECSCAQRNFYGFFVFSSGKAILLHRTLASLYYYIDQNRETIIYSNILYDRTPNHSEINGVRRDELFCSSENNGSIFIEQVKLSAERGVKIRNCFLCRYQGENWDYDGKNPIFCKGKKMKCKSNEAATCDWYKIDIIPKAKL
ncbi:competence protein CoiA family protein [Aeromonas rivipollensis]|uniref:competence protein CoiA family protein n=2 Tax=Aeromonas rivipollensis TaxID=948519 RepID=UPI0038D6A917